MKTKTKKGNMTIIAIIIVVVVIAIGIIGWLLSRRAQQAPPPQAKAQPATETTQSADDITNWKTYTNEKLGFEVKYPANWFAIESDNENRVYFQNISKDSLKKPYPDNLRMVWISYDQKESDESNFLVESSANLKKYSANVEGVNINIYEDSLAETGETFTDAFWRYNDQLYSASTLGGEFSTANAAGKAETEQNKILKEILSTLQFTK